MHDETYSPRYPNRWECFNPKEHDKPVLLGRYNHTHELEIRGEGGRLYIVDGGGVTASCPRCRKVNYFRR